MGCLDLKGRILLKMVRTIRPNILKDVPRYSVRSPLDKV